MKINWTRLAKDIGGKYLVDRRSLLLMVPFIVVISVLSNSTAIKDASLLPSSAAYRYAGLVIANIASIATCWLYLEAVDRTLFKNKEKNPIKIPWVLVFGASLGFLKGLTTGLFSWLIGSEIDLNLAIGNRILQTSLLGLWTIPLVSVVASTFIRFQEERQILLTESLESGKKSKDFLVNSSESSERLSVYLINAKDEISKLRANNSSSNSSEISGKLRDLVENGLRPISHKIWQENSKRSGRLSLGHLARLAVQKNPFPGGLILFGLAIGLFPINLSAFPLGEGILRTLVMLFITGIILFAAKQIPRKSNFSIWGTFFGANLISTFLSVALTDALFGVALEFGDLAIWLALFLWLVQLSLFSSVVSEVLTTRAEIRQQLVRSLDQEQLDSDVRGALARIKNRELAQYIHGNIQNKLLSFALKFDQENLSTDDVSKLLTEVEGLFSKAIHEYQTVASENLDEQLAHLTDRWSGFVEVQLSNGLSTLNLSNQDIKSVVEVVSEAASNAVRHGLAKNLKVRLEIADSDHDHIEVVVEDDGLGPRSGKAGLGTELFNAASGINWSLGPGKFGGSVLRVRLSIQA